MAGAEKISYLCTRYLIKQINPLMKVRTTYIPALAFAAMLPFAANAVEPTIADHMNTDGNVTVTQPYALNARLVKTMPVVEEENIADEDQPAIAAPKVRAGYRIQVFDDNNVRTAKDEAQSRKNQIESRFPMLTAYVTFNSPYWRVKVGDFTTRSEAEAVMAEIRQAFPSLAKSLRIVRDRIKH